VLAWLVSAANRLASEICFYGDCAHGSIHVVTNRLSYVVCLTECVHVVATPEITMFDLHVVVYQTLVANSCVP
jgi:hypothetical protein